MEIKSVYPRVKTIYLAGGCFWGVEGYFRRIKGVIDTEVGYANGKKEDPSYEDVCRGDTGHAETVMIKYDANIVSLEELLLRFYEIIDPTSFNRQGNDIGTQYRTGIYFVDPEGEKAARKINDVLAAKHAASGSRDASIPFKVEIRPLDCFYPAEEYHRRYLEKNPRGYCHIPLGLADEPVLGDFTATEKGDELRKRIGDEAFDVTQKAATERAGSSPLNFENGKGIYVDVVTGQPLFTSDKKFDAGCGWPSFTAPITSDSLECKEDNSFGMRRVEVGSRDGKSHLGHVFPDGPADGGGLRYCINGAALRFIPYDSMDDEGYGDYKPFFE